MPYTILGVNLDVLDVLLLLLIAAGALSGLRQGAVTQALSLIGAGVGALAAVWVLPEVAAALPAMDRYLRAVLILLFLLLALATGQAFGSAVAAIVVRHIGRTPLAGVDRLAGFLLGAAQVVLAVWFLAPILAAGPSQTISDQIAQSTVVTAVRTELPSPAPVLGRVRAFLDPVGLPQVFQFLGGPVGPSVAVPSGSSVTGLADRVAPSTVEVVGEACGLRLSGTGFAIAPGYIVTNAHVVAGEQGTTAVITTTGATTGARVVFYDPGMDVALLYAPGLPVPALPLATSLPAFGATGVALGHPGGGGLAAVPAAVRDTFTATGFDIYGQRSVTRVVIEIAADVQAGDSGGPFVTSDGRVAGVVFAKARSSAPVGYALTIGEVRSDLAGAMGSTRAVSTEACTP